MALFINGIGSISPVPSLADIALDLPTTQPNNRLSAIEPNYAAFIDPKVSRRMSRIVKMGLASAKQALLDAGLVGVDGVIAGTGWGCVEDTVSFLQKMVVNGEDMLSPTAFIHSTHNTIAGHIAYHLQCRGYNSTYVHRNISFESTLIDATMLLAEQPQATFLVGGIDELTDTSFDLLERLHTFKTQTASPAAPAYGTGTRGTWAGEGATYFAVAAAPCPHCYAKLLEVRTVSFSTPAEAALAARQLLARHNLPQVDLLLSGDNGDAGNDAACQEFSADFGHQLAALRFKHLCGEYPTASAFALGLAANLLAGRSGSHDQPAPTSILIYNRFQQAHQSLMLLTAC